MNCNTKLKTIFYITKRPTFFVKYRIQNEGEGLKRLKTLKSLRSLTKQTENTNFTNLPKFSKLPFESRSPNSF